MTENNREYVELVKVKAKSTKLKLICCGCKRDIERREYTILSYLRNIEDDSKNLDGSYCLKCEKGKEILHEYELQLAMSTVVVSSII